MKPDLQVVLYSREKFFYRSDCVLGNPEFTKKSTNAKRFSVEEALLKIKKLREKGFYLEIISENDL